MEIKNNPVIVALSISNDLDRAQFEVMGLTPLDEFKKLINEKILFAELDSYDSKDKCKAISAFIFVAGAFVYLSNEIKRETFVHKMNKAKKATFHADMNSKYVSLEMTEEQFKNWITMTPRLDNVSRNRFEGIQIGDVVKYCSDVEYVVVGFHLANEVYIAKKGLDGAKMSWTFEVEKVNKYDLTLLEKIEERISYE